MKAKSRERKNGSLFLNPLRGFKSFFKLFLLALLIVLVLLSIGFIFFPPGEIKKEIENSVSEISKIPDYPPLVFELVNSCFSNSTEVGNLPPNAKLILNFGKVKVYTAGGDFYATYKGKTYKARRKLIGFCKGALEIIKKDKR